MPTIVLENVGKKFKVERRRYDVAVSEVNLTINQGEFVFFVGSSGAGKSTLLKLISGNLKPDWGKVMIDNRDVQKMRRFNKNRTMLMFGQVWQEPSLMRKRTVRENLEIAALIGTTLQPLSRGMVKERIEKTLGLVGMAGCEERYPVELSCGEERRVELARALINSPPILVLDEITGNLDDDNIWDIFQLLNEINQRGTTVLMATHASQYVNIMRRRVITMVDGRVFGDVKRGKYGDVV